MIQLAVVAAAAAVIGGVAAVTPRDSRLVALGLLVAMVATPLASSSEPTGLAVAFRILGAVLAIYLLWAATRDRSIESEGSGIGAAAELIAAAAAFSVGWFVTPVKPLAGPVAAQAAGFALMALAIVPMAGRNVFRVGAGLVLLLLGISLLLEAWVGAGSSLRQVVLTVLLVGTVGATSLLLSPAEADAAELGHAAAERTASAEREGTTQIPDEAEPDEGAIEGATESVETATAETRSDGVAIGMPRAKAAPKASAKASAGTPADAGAVPVAVPAAPKRVSTARTSKPRAPRANRVAASGGPVKRAGPVDDATPPLPAPSPQPAPAPNRARRPNPRVQREPRVSRKARESTEPKDSGQ